MTTPESIPVFMIGRSAKNAEILLPLLKPEIDGIHLCESTAIARQELPLVLQGKPLTPASGVGSNATRGDHPLKPVALFVGAGFTDEDYLAFRKDVGEAHGLPWVRERKGDLEGLDRKENWTTEFGSKMPKAEVLAKSVRKAVLGRLRGDDEFTSR